jgi:uncharacterized protein with PQ loop repeat
MESEDWVGWAASALLICTLAHQIYTQNKDISAKGVSPALFVGQSLSSVGFIVYSVLLGNAVFVVTNSLLLTAIIGQVSLWRRQARKSKG